MTAAGGAAPLGARARRRERAAARTARAAPVPLPTPAIDASTKTIKFDMGGKMDAKKKKIYDTQEDYAGPKNVSEHKI